MANKKLVFIVNVDWFFLSHRLPIALEAIKNGYEVHLVAKNSGLKSKIAQYGIIFHDINFSRSGSKLTVEINTILKLQRLLSELRPDLIHAVTIKPVIYSGLVLHALSFKPSFIAAISGLGYVFSASSLKAKITKFLVSILYKVAFNHKDKTIIFQNSTDDRILSEVVVLESSDKVLIKGSGADLSLYNALPEPVGDSVTIVMACRLLKEKGVYEYVEAAKIIRAKHSNVEFILAGTPDLENPNSVSQAEVDEWHSQGIINAIGHCDNIPRVFSESHIVTLPSYYGEGVPKVLIEAAACGRAVVTTDNPGCRDAIIPDITGILVPVKDHNALADALINLIEDNKRRLTMSVAARDYAVKEFDVRFVVDKHIAIYNYSIRKGIEN